MKNFMSVNVLVISNNPCDIVQIRFFVWKDVYLGAVITKTRLINSIHQPGFNHGSTRLQTLPLNSFLGGTFLISQKYLLFCDSC